MFSLFLSGLLPLLNLNHLKVSELHLFVAPTNVFVSIIHILRVRILRQDRQSFTQPKLAIGLPLPIQLQPYNCCSVKIVITQSIDTTRYWVSYLATVVRLVYFIEPMQTKVIKLDPYRADIAKIKEAAALVDGGGLVAFPTESVYGIACRAQNDSLIKLNNLKGRDSDKYYTLHIGQKNEAKNTCLLSD